MYWLNVLIISHLYALVLTISLSFKQRDNVPLLLLFRWKQKNAVTYCKYLLSIDSPCYSSHLSVLPTERQPTTRLPCYCQSGLRPHRDSLDISYISNIYQYIFITFMYSIELTFDNHFRNNVEVIWKCGLHFWTVVRNKVAKQLLLSGTSWMHI